MQRRAQKPITIRSNRAAELLAIHTRNGRSQAAVIEDALERMPQSALTSKQQRAYDDIIALARQIPAGAIPAMAEFDAEEYDEYGDPR